MVVVGRSGGKGGVRAGDRSGPACMRPIVSVLVSVDIPSANVHPGANAGMRPERRVAGQVFGPAWPPPDVRRDVARAHGRQRR